MLTGLLFLILELIEDREGKLWVGTQSSGRFVFGHARLASSSPTNKTRELPERWKWTNAGELGPLRSHRRDVGWETRMDWTGWIRKQGDSASTRSAKASGTMRSAAFWKAGWRTGLWISTNNGVARVRARVETIRQFFSTALKWLPGRI
jgi:hypothetical protein